MSTTAMKHEDPRPALSRQRVVHTAIQHADSAGLDALTMRQVAGMLQVAPMALYRHI
ncbi:MAG TPA: TetR family transcriptional regulator, partial [Arthrobacter bacterium]|nr:TetR family transcriptional regulator [Arthrobacter sp.]